MDDEFYANEDEAEVQLSEFNAKINLPDFYQWKINQIYEYDSQVNDYESMEELSKSISKARTALFRLNDKINEYERKERVAKLEYERKYRREYLKSTEKTETAKRTRAELKCEELENEWIKNEQLTKELNRMAFAVRTELQTLQTIANNLRQQLKMV